MSGYRLLCGTGQKQGGGGSFARGELWKFWEAALMCDKFNMKNAA